MNFLTLQNVYFSDPNLSKGVIWKSFLSESSWSFHSLYNSHCMSGIFCFPKSNNWSVKLGNSSWNSHRTRHDCCREKECTAGGSLVKNPPASAGDAGSIPGLGRSPGEGNGNPLQYTCLGNPMDKGAWWATVHGVTKSGTQLSKWASVQSKQS